MIVKCGKVLIDTTANHEVHKNEIESKTSFYCNKDEPSYWFTQNVDGEHRFYHLNYNDDGSKLQSITSWDELKPHEVPKKLEKQLKSCKDTCYFTKGKNHTEDEYVMVEVIDYSKNHTSKNHTTVWDHKWSDNVVMERFELSSKPKSRWKFWS